MIDNDFETPTPLALRGETFLARSGRAARSMAALFAASVRIGVARIGITCAVLLPSLASATAPTPVLPVRVVVVTADEIGADTGDSPGEYQAWAEKAPKILPFPAGFRHLRYDPVRQILLIMTGVGTNRAATSIMALGLDHRFDLRRAYWLVAAVAGVNPDEASAGSAAWIGNVVDTDFAVAVDPREAPKGWPTGTLAFGAKAPYEGHPTDSSSNLFPLNIGLRDWAYALTKTISLPDTPALRHLRSAYSAFPKAVTPPAVVVGDEASGQTFWHGPLLNQHAEAWTRYWTGGKGHFVMTAMEDTGVLRALEALGRDGRVDPRRALVLRTGANYSMPAPGIGAAESLLHESTEYSAYQPSLNAAFVVGGRVVDELTSNWSRYRDTIPTASSPAR